MTGRGGGRDRAGLDGGRNRAGQARWRLRRPLATPGSHPARTRGLLGLAPGVHVAGPGAGRCRRYGEDALRQGSRVGEGVACVAADLEKAHFEAPVVPDVSRWQYARLLSNLGNALEAVSGPIGDPRAEALYAPVRAEGESALRAAGIPYASTEEQRAARGDKMTLVPLDDAPRGGSSWQSLSRGTGTIEAGHLNGEIVLLGRLHGVPTPLNELLQRLANEFARERRAPGSLPLQDLLRLADDAVAFLQDSPEPRFVA